jgi:5,10-methylene-tetrahydrofolate dehydrogenase/methenyl tetrahydrofolate cyclohydrolase
MTYLEQIESYVEASDGVVLAEVPMWCGVTVLPTYPHVIVALVDEDLVTLRDEHAVVVARCRLVG